MKTLERDQGQWPAQRGVSLVEAMIALALGLLVTLGASTAFTASRQANRATEGLGRMQETARSAFDLMAREVREAGGNPCDSAVAVASVLNGAQGATPSWWADWDNPLQGFEGNVSFPGAAFGTGVGQRVAGTDAVLAKYASDLSDLNVVTHTPGTMTITVNNSPHRLQAGELLFVCNYSQGSIAQASSVSANTIVHDVSAASAGNCSTGLGVPTACAPAAPNVFTYLPGSKVARFVASGWYIGNNGRADTGGRSLYRATRTGVEEVAEGVNDMQVTYLSSGAALYVDASAITDWSKVVGLRLALMLNSVQAGVSTSADTRMTRPMTFTLSLRNRQS